MTVGLTHPSAPLFAPPPLSPLKHPNTQPHAQCLLPSCCRSAAAAPDADLSAFEGHELHVVPSNATLTFEHSYGWWVGAPGG